jgi:hypothetical protein
MLICSLEEKMGSSNWKRETFESFADEVRSNIGGKEVVYIVILTVIFLFASLTLHARIAVSQITNFNGYKETIVVKYYGAPFEMLSVWWLVAQYFSGSLAAGTATVIWGGLLADVAIFSLSAFFIILAVTKVRNDRERARYYS